MDYSYLKISSQKTLQTNKNRQVFRNFSMLKANLI